MREFKKFERGAEKSARTGDGMLKLAFFDVDLKNSSLLMSIDDFDDKIFDERFIVKSGEWHTEDGWVVGKNPKMCPGMIISKEDFFGNVMLELTVQMVPPATHDINVMINGEWDEEKDERGNAYVAGMEAFWHGNVGFEKSPEYKLTAATPLFDFDPSREYNFKMGNVEGKVFVLIDDKLCLEISDPDPLDTSKYGRIGFEAYSSWWKFKNVRVYGLKYEKIEEYYNPEF
ncbi:MAG: hypothetical protein IKV53_07695 [Clostridia bacterium]|nr:hypothetical protein [Clostridia bacterium]